MSSVVPNGQIRFFENVPIDSNYENSLDFLTKEAQYEFFLGLTFKHRMIGATRVRDGVISVDTVSDNLLNCNYMMFQNENFSSKWFFAFIIDVQYVNNNMCYVFYQIDDIQTWMFDVTLEECFVEREHTPTDGLFEHLVDEGINCAEYTTMGRERETMKNTSVIIFTASKVESGVVVRSVPHFYEGLASMVGTLQFHVMDEDETIVQNGLDLIESDINAMTLLEQNDSICSGICFPDKFTSIGAGSSDTTIAHPRNINFPTRTATLNGYTPKNKKMYNSPFCLYKLCASDGQQSILQPEKFTTPTNRQIATLYPAVTPNPAILGVPLAYENQLICYNKSISFDGFPQFAMSIDGFKAWIASGGLAKTLLHTTSNIAGNVISGAVGAQSGNPAAVANTVVNTATEIGDLVITMATAKNLPSDIKGNMNSTPLMCNNDAEFYTLYETILGDVAESIDNYFTMYGYKVNKLKKPSRRNRPHYTYLKTKGCHVDGGAPADAIQRIETIYDNGIRFWVNASEVGKFSEVDNSPV